MKTTWKSADVRSFGMAFTVGFANSVFVWNFTTLTIIFWVRNWKIYSGWLFFVKPTTSLFTIHRIINGTQKTSIK